MLRLREGGPEWIIPTSLDQMSAWGLLRCGWGGGGEEKSITCNGVLRFFCLGGEVSDVTASCVWGEGKQVSHVTASGV